MANIILCGYNWAGCMALELLRKKKHNIFVYTHENPPHINSLILLCKKNNIPHSTAVIKKENLPFKPEMICSIYYRYIIPPDIITFCNKIINLHPSLLPKYRGCSSLTWAMINGEKFAGFSYHYVNNKIDNGNIIFQKKIPIYNFDTQASLYNRVMVESMKHFNKCIKLASDGFKGKKQPLIKSEYYKRGCPYSGLINPAWPIDKIERFIKAMIYPPLPYARFQDHEIKCLNDYLSLKKSNRK